VTAAVTEHEIAVRGARIGYDRRPVPGAPPVLFVHGAGAHRHWWDEVLDTTPGRWDATAMDLGGHGRSGHREAYTAEVWAQEIADVIAATSPTGRSALVAHSMGGLVAVAAAALHPDRVQQLIIMDIRIGGAPADQVDVPRGTPRRTPTVHPDLETAIHRFHLLPEGSEVDPAALRRLAARSYVETDGGWRVRFDPEARRVITDRDIDGWLPRIRCGIALIGGERSGNVSEENARHIAELAGRPVRWGNVPRTHHHLQLERPEAVAAVLGEIVDGDRSDAVPGGLRTARP
jgi:pimeloyl-ACP methyl ester carboxylesterase